jgi:16S rRNA G1207 methylase RsmC
MPEEESPGGVGQTHYFSERPAGAGTRNSVPVVLAGRELEVVTAGGVFSAERLDLGTRVLLREAPPPPASGQLLDLGCGWGPLALTLGLLSPAATVWAVDVNPRALELTRENARRAGVHGLRAAAPDEVPADVAFDAIWSNPPIRIGKAALHDLLLTWLARLAPDGVARLVVARNLGADTLQRWLIDQGYAAERAASSKGFRVLVVSRVRPG